MRGAWMAAMGQVASGWLSSRLPGQRGLRGLGVDAQDPQALEEDISALCVLFEQAEAEHLVLPAAIDYHQEHLHLLRPQLCDDLRRKAAFPILHQRVDVLDGRDGTGHLGLAIVPVVNNDQVLEAPVDAVLPRDAVSRALRDIGARAPSDGLLGKVVHQILDRDFSASFSSTVRDLAESTGSLPYPDGDVAMGGATMGAVGRAYVPPPPPTSSALSLMWPEPSSVVEWKVFWSLSLLSVQQHIANMAPTAALRETRPITVSGFGPCCAGPLAAG
eukprot:CAMPEP_0195068346 /NCGR_PEP_ID=MMETSP0448-20130528/13115_1 /TAXON_ID=66468 /ORGANISM="Heterocapsa triquestra, Strain CCMP 448" /LENGTH=273 /DNA_ID=CAMNT_0040099873 /DNA_START=185 /DNA_END=1003 /DNA_ORIENTATION=+